MVLSLAFVLAFIGAGVSLLVGILIFSEVSEAIECPAPAGSGGATELRLMSYDNLGTFGATDDAIYAESEIEVDFLPSVVGILNEAVIQEGTASLSNNGEIYLGDLNTEWDFFHKSNVGFNEVSINLWINGDVDGSPMYPILSNFGSGTPENGINIFTQSNQLRAIVHADDGQQRVAGNHVGIPADDSQWHMITVTYDKSITTPNPNMKIYLDGVLLGTTNTASDFSSVGGSAKDKLTIGSDDDHNTSGGVTENTFKVDDVGIWNGYLLTGTDVSNLYNSGSGSVASSISSGSLVGYWSFDDPTANYVEFEIGESVLFDTLGETSDGTYSQQPNWWIGQIVATNGEEITSVTVNDMVKQVNIGTIKSEIYTGATTDIDSATLVGTSNILDLSGAFDPSFDLTLTFNPPVTVSDPNTLIALKASSNWDSDNIFLTSSSDIGGNEGIFVAHDPVTTSGFTSPVADMLMKVSIAGGGGGGSGQGSEECESAKETAWTVIGIMPIALFFGLFALFSSIMPRPT